MRRWLAAGTLALGLGCGAFLDQDAMDAVDGGALASWTLPDDLEAALTRAGWQVSGCMDELADGARWAECAGDKGTWSASVNVTRYDDAREVDDGASEGEIVRIADNTELRVTVLDVAEAVKLCDAMLDGGSIAKVDLRKGLTDAGYRVTRCSTERADGKESSACDAEQGGRYVVTTRSSESGSEGELDRSQESGVVTSSQGYDLLTVMVVDEGASRTLADQLIR